jgi:hypothetical protein
MQIATISAAEYADLKQRIYNVECFLIQKFGFNPLAQQTQPERKETGMGPILDPNSTFV